MSRFADVRRWAGERNLIEGSNTARQFLKLIEETGELAAGLARQQPVAIKDGIGDVMVVLTIIAAQSNLSIEECLEHAWNEIKDRKGKMVDGIFVKEI